MDQGERVVPSGHLPDWIGLGVLAAAVPRDAIEEALAAHWRGVKRRGGKLPPHVMVYFAMGMALYADADYEEIITELSDGLDRLGCWDADWEVPGSGAITRAAGSAWAMRCWPMCSTPSRSRSPSCSLPVLSYDPWQPSTGTVIPKGAHAAGRSHGGCAIPWPDASVRLTGQEMSSSVRQPRRSMSSTVVPRRSASSWKMEISRCQARARSAAAWWTAPAGSATSHAPPSSSTETGNEHC